MRQSLLENRLLALMPEEDLWRLQIDLEQVSWKRGEVFAQPDTPHPYTFFPTGGVVSVVTTIDGQCGSEFGMYGREGFGPASIAFGVDRSPHRHLVQGQGAAWRIPTRRLSDALDHSRSLQSILLKFAHVLSLQTSFTAHSNVSLIAVRLARWLVMCHDRADGNDLDLTHEFLGSMLSVRRSGVTDAIHNLEGEKIIRATRGKVRILDRDRLKAMAGSGYGVPEAEYRRLIGPLNGTV